MPITLTNYASGEIEIDDGAGRRLRLSRDQANRLVMLARMHTVAEFIEELPRLLEDPTIRATVLQAFTPLTTPTDRWNFKEKFARLRTLTREAPAGDPTGVIEKVIL